MAHRYRARVEWRRQEGEPFTDNRYSRGHDWFFDEGVTVPASSSPLHVRLPFSRADAVDPEEAFVAALSSCHMLFFLSLAAKAGHVVDSYLDAPEGVMGRNEAGADYLATVTLRPRLSFAGDPPDRAAIAALHHRAHELCYLANSVRSEVVIASPDTDH